MALEQSILLKNTALIYGILRQCNHFHPLKYLKLFKYHGIWVCVSVCVLVFSHVWLFATLWTVAHQGPLSIGSSRQKYWSGLPFSSPGVLPDCTQVSFITGRFFTVWTTREAYHVIKQLTSILFKIIFEKNSYCCFSDRFMISLSIQWNILWLTYWVWSCV